MEEHGRRGAESSSDEVRQEPVGTRGEFAKQKISETMQSSLVRVAGPLDQED